MEVRIRKRIQGTTQKQACRLTLLTSLDSSDEMLALALCMGCRPTLRC